MKKLLPLIMCVLLLLTSLPVSAAEIMPDIDVDAAEQIVDDSDVTEITAKTEDDSDELAEVGADFDLAETGWSLLTEEQFQNKMATVRSNYPNGGVYSGIYYEYGAYKAETCWGYACQMMYEFFNAMFYADGLLQYKDYNSNVSAGDWVRIDWDSHSIFIIKVTDSGIYYTDGNGDGANGIRWDAYMSWSEFNNRFCWRVHLPGNNLTGTGKPVISHTIAYDANGGSGSMSSFSVRTGASFYLDDNEFYRAGYDFAGYTVNRAYDNKWFCVNGKGWRSMSEINENGYTLMVYPEGGSYSMSQNWLGNITESTTFTFYAQWKPIEHTIAYSANGGSGSMSSFSVPANGSFTLDDNEFYRSGYSFGGYTVKRSYDNKWYTADAGWQTLSDIYNNNYTFKFYPEGRSYTLGKPWLGTITTSTAFTFYAEWIPDTSVIEFIDNYSGYNYLLGSDFSDGFGSYIYSRDKSVYTLSSDSSERFNNQISLKVTGKSAGASGADLAWRTTTNSGYGDGYTQLIDQGDEKDLTMRISIKSPTDGAKFYIRWGFQSDYKSVTLSKGWKTYTISLPKNCFFGANLHPYFDKAGTYYISSASLADSTWNTSIKPEKGDHAASSYTIERGTEIGRLPVPEREGYTFLGWYTMAEGGDLVTPDTVIYNGSLRLYAHWIKDISVTPLKTIESNGHVYELYDNVMEWEDAELFCELQGGHLVTIDGYYENNLVYQMIKDQVGYCWIGLSYDTGSGKWNWVTGEQYSFNYWYHSSYGTQYTTDEHYAMMYPMNLNGTAYSSTWDKVAGSNYYRSFYGYYNSFFVCEYDYQLGDTNGDNDVAADDVTVIQRTLADEESPINAAMVKRADIDMSGEMEITDATFIQRWLADIEIPYHIPVIDP